MTVAQSKTPDSGPLAQLDASQVKSFIKFFDSISSTRDGAEGLDEVGASASASAPPSPAPVIRLFDRKTCISVHGYGQEPYVVSRLLYKSVAQVCHLSSSSSSSSSSSALASITLTHTLLPSLLKDLLMSGRDDAVKYRVEYWSLPANATRQDEWELLGAARPGRLDAFIEQQLMSNPHHYMEEHPVNAAVAVRYDASQSQRTVGLAYVDVLGHRMGACEFVDDARFCTLEACLTQLGPKEVVVCEDLFVEKGGLVGSTGACLSKDGRTLMNVFADCNGILVTRKSSGFFKANSLEEDLTRLLKQGSVVGKGGGLEHVVGGGGVIGGGGSTRSVSAGGSALAGVIGFVELLSDAGHHGRFELEQYMPEKYMRVDAAAQKALNVLKSKSDANDSFSLYGLMDRCGTPMGKRLLKTWLKQPLRGKEEIEERLDVVEVLAGDAGARDDLREVHLRGVPDVHRLGRRLDTRVATLKELCDLHRMCTRLPGIVRVLEEAVVRAGGPGGVEGAGGDGRKAALVREKFVAPLREAADGEHLGKFQDLVEAAVDFERIPEEYLINPEYDDALKEIEGKKKGVEREIEAIAEAAAAELGLELGKTVKLEWHKVANQKTRCLRITKKEEKGARGAMKRLRYIELEVRKDGTKFTNDRLRGAAERLQDLSGQYDRTQAKLVAQVVEVAATFSHVWETVAGVLAELDVLNGFAVLSMSAPIPYVRPVLIDAMDGDSGPGTGDGQEIVLKGSRHPCVEAQDSVSFIPNDIVMRKGESWFQIITGPNMGGKSTYIRQIGMCVLMAQVGCFVPCDEATIAIRDAIFARVGAGDCQMRGVSTFMAEMLETASILKGATDKSLVIIDELGRGTSTWDGMGLAWAISEHLMEKIGAATLFATHFHELTALKGSVGVKNMHVKSTIDAARGGLTMLYQVHEGSCDQSLGIHVAEFARFPQKIIDDAKAKALELDGTMVVDIVEATKKDKDGGEERERERKRERGAPASEEDVKRVLMEFARVDFGSGAEANPELVEAWRSKLQEAVGEEVGRTKHFQDGKRAV